ncbi:MAG: PSD1 and planctomycete cytochrome C domain-containing protein [Acidobacteria bacterium]|nr:PSD1 and planctomycete cytochrome C domain-containing protein [Acidobacteriota bacterium]
MKMKSDSRLLTRAVQCCPRYAATTVGSGSYGSYLVRLSVRVVSLILLCLPAFTDELKPDPREFFTKRVQPIFANKCWACHTDSKLGGLQLDSLEHVLKGGKSGPAIVPGDPDRSLLVKAITYTHERLKMPPPGKLEDAEITVIKKWVQDGAHWPGKNEPAPTAEATGYVIRPEQRAFWSFQPLRMPSQPSVKDTSWARSPIDYFILNKLEVQGLQPVKLAEKTALIRRASFDLIGLPPTPEEVDKFQSDSSPQAFARVVDRLLASPHFGERWGRYWLDVARYGEDDARGTRVESYSNAWRYRDWVIEAFNRDMPYDLFVKAQIAGDLLEEPSANRLKPALGFFGVGPWFYDVAKELEARAFERDAQIDALTRGFLGLTVACARCHNHKFDPIAANDYYALAGVFASSDYHEYPLVPESQVQFYNEQVKRTKEQEKLIEDFRTTVADQLAEILTRKIAAYLMGAWKVTGPDRSDLATVAKRDNLDCDTLERWIGYLANPDKDHPYLESWNQFLAKRASDAELQKFANEFQSLAVETAADKKRVEKENQQILSQITPPTKILGPNGFTGDDPFGLLAGKTLERDRYVLWGDLFRRKARKGEIKGILIYDGDALDRFLRPEWKSHLETLRAELETLKKAVPAPFPYFMGLKESPEPTNAKVNIRGNPYDLGDEAPRRFLQVLCGGEPAPYTHGSGRRELAEAVARHPLTARVMVNRVWDHLFGRGIVRTPSNFGQNGDRPSHPELLEYLAARFDQQKGSVKGLVRELMLSSVYQLSTEYSGKNVLKDPDNQLFWHANQKRLDVEALRDTLLFVSGTLDSSVGGPSQELNADNHRRTVYAKISRVKADEMLVLFDFPNAIITSERRSVTNVPSQQLFFLNSKVIFEQSRLLAERLRREAGEENAARIRLAYRLLYGRTATEAEVRIGLGFLAHQSDPKTADQPWQKYTQILLASNEFSYLD